MQNTAQIPFTLSEAQQHTMGAALYQYLNIKIHDYIKEKAFDTILIVGKYDRQSNISKYEKTGKKANWQRPTARLEGRVLWIEVFPGMDYVRHYAALISTYFAINDLPMPTVQYCLPTEADCWVPIHESDLSQLTPTEYVITGYALPEIAKDTHWQEYDTFHAQQTTIGGKTVTFVSVKHSFWGDIGGRLVAHWATLGFEKVIFIGKVGGLKAAFQPNGHLATGHCSLVEGEVICWDNIFADVKEAVVQHGPHISSPSVLFETKEWLQLMQDRFSFVDPEIGQFARAAVRHGVGFGYLHLISNTLVENNQENLSNERHPNILKKRAALIATLQAILYTTISS